MTQTAYVSPTDLLYVSTNIGGTVRDRAVNISDLLDSMLTYDNWPASDSLHSNTVHLGWTEFNGPITNGFFSLFSGGIDVGETTILGDGIDLVGTARVGGGLNTPGYLRGDRATITNGLHVIGTATNGNLRVQGTATFADLTPSRVALIGPGQSLDVSTVTPTELGHVSGVTSPIQTQLNAKQAADADLDDLADGSLTGSKVGTGINADNITAGTLPDARLSSAVTLDADWDTSAEIKANVTDETGTGGALMFSQSPAVSGIFTNSGNLRQVGAAEFFSDITQTGGDLITDGGLRGASINISGEVTGGSMEITNNAHVGGTLTIDGVSTFNDDTAFGFLSATSIDVDDLTVNNTMTAAEAHFDLLVVDTLTVTNATTNMVHASSQTVYLDRMQSVDITNAVSGNVSILMTNAVPGTGGSIRLTGDGTPRTLSFFAGASMTWMSTNATVNGTNVLTAANKQTLIGYEVWRKTATDTNIMLWAINQP